MPTGAFTGAGTSFPNGSSAGGGHVVWESRYVHQTDCSGVEVSEWSGAATVQVLPGASGPDAVGAEAEAPKGPADFTSQVNIAPVIGGVALLGEAGKITSVSAYRFASVGAGPAGKGLSCWRNRQAAPQAVALPWHLPTE